MQAATGVQALHNLFCSTSEDVLHWPPDIFGFAAHFAKVSGIYRYYLQNPELVKDIRLRAPVDGKRWKSGLNRKNAAVPKSIREAWEAVCANVSRKIEDLKKDDLFCYNILYLLACADESCAGVGLPDQTPPSSFEVRAQVRLSANGNLCKLLPADVVRVLPRLHTPQKGLNVRSLSHHLGLVGANEVAAKWTQSRTFDASKDKRIKILLAPWPLRLGIGAYTKAGAESKNKEKFGYFDYKPGSDAGAPNVAEWLQSRLLESTQVGLQPDMVIFPECSLTDKEWSVVAKLCSAQGISVIAGVHGRKEGSTRSLNALKIRLPLVFEDLVQHKHHRWQLDESQVRAYSFGSSLAESKLWWENIEIEERTLHFVCASADLTFCALICEDLAREDPAAEMVRAVGPNLLVALLSDGPQLSNRWASRYASVLADDPGCSVLTVSSLGMVERSRPNGVAVNRTVASWKDAFGNFVPIDLGVSEDCLVIDLRTRIKEEWSADGRSDGDVSTYPVLAGIHGLGGRI